jgi:hypothetical protein
VKSIRQAMDRRRAPFYLRRTKEAMVHFPERRADGSWSAEPIFTKRIPHTVDFQIDGAEFDLYRDVTRFVKRESARAAAQDEDPRARAIGFLMSLYQLRTCCKKPQSADWARLRAGNGISEPFAYHHDRGNLALATRSAREDQPKRQPTNVHSWTPVTLTTTCLRRPRVPAASRPPGSQFPGDLDQVV